MDGRELWLVASGDRRVSVWSSDWSKTSCQLVDWLTFPGPACAPDGTVLHKGKKVMCLYYECLLSDVLAQCLLSWWLLIMLLYCHYQCDHMIISV